jgi:hypothetical protein
MLAAWLSEKKGESLHVSSFTVARDYADTGALHSKGTKQIVGTRNKSG